MTLIDHGVFFLDIFVCGGAAIGNGPRRGAGRCARLDLVGSGERH